MFLIDGGRANDISRCGKRESLVQWERRVGGSKLAIPLSISRMLPRSPWQRQTTNWGRNSIFQCVTLK